MAALWWTGSTFAEIGLLDEKAWRFTEERCGAGCEGEKLYHSEQAMGVMRIMDLLLKV